MFTLNKTYLFAAGCALLLYGCASAPREAAAPQWVTDPDAVYSGTEYLNGVGEGANRAEAELQAAAALAKSIVQTVEAASSASQQYSSADAAGGIAQNYQSVVQTSSSIEGIAGARIREAWTAPDGTVYALAQINRSESGNVYKSRIDANTAVIAALINQADRRGPSFESLTALRQAQALAEENKSDLILLAGINSNLARVVDLPYKSADAVRVLADRMQDALSVALSVSGDTNGRIAAALSQALARIGLKTTGEADDAPLLLEANFSVEPADIDPQYAYVRFTLDVILTDTATGTAEFSFSRNGREAHMSESEAAQRALRAAETLIAAELTDELSRLTDAQQSAAQ